MTTNVLLFFILIVVVLILTTSFAIKSTFDKLSKTVKENQLKIKFFLYLSFAFILFSIFAPYFFTDTLIGNTIISGKSSAETGDTIGGIMNPFIAIAAAILTFLAFWVQFKANQEVQKQFKIQQFESQFYEMLRLHKENINEMRITGYEPSIEASIQKDNEDNIISKTETITTVARITEGRKVFVTMATELIACFEILEYYNNLWQTNIDEQHLLELAYQFFFFGSKSDVVSSNNIDNSIIENFRIEINKIRDLHKNSSGVKNRIKGLNGKEIKLYIKYLPFSGHENRLGHYYRHLYSTVKYIVNKEKEGLLKYKLSREYLKILRSQMSNDEQLMLYYNYIIGFGREWGNEGYLTKYRMLHNLPINKVKYAVNPREHFKVYIDSIKPGEGELFEWGDIES